MKSAFSFKLLASFAAVTSVVAASYAYWILPRQMPAEYKTLEVVLNKISKGNNFGRQPLAFMIVTGSYAGQLAQERSLCKADNCDFFAQLNPFKTYKNGWDELVQQGYALGDINGWATSSGTIMIPRPAFRAYGNDINYLSCTVAHEIAHVRRNHIFKQSYHNNHDLKEMNKKDKNLANLKRSRELELEADREAANMLAKAGYKGRICLNDIDFMYRSTGDGSATEPDSSHSGYDDRRKAMLAHYIALEKNPPKPEKSSYRYFKYAPKDNLLLFIPK